MRYSPGALDYRKTPCLSPVGLPKARLDLLPGVLHAMPEAQLNDAERESRVMWRSEVIGGVLLQ